MFGCPREIFPRDFALCSPSGFPAATPIRRGELNRFLFSRFFFFPTDPGVSYTIGERASGSWVGRNDAMARDLPDVRESLVSLLLYHGESETVGDDDAGGK